ncbi:hypothetical protein HDU67_005952 [Dinochytrium kinnereticum]|nr:hypothetical protein HDU67_005952 [Dinochytrium kinnereticum]
MKLHPSARMAFIPTVVLLLLLVTAPLAWAQSSLAIVFESSTLDEVLSLGYSGLAVTGCERAAQENPGYSCKFIFKPAGMEFDASLVQFLSSTISGDSSIVHTIFVGFGFLTVSKTIAQTFPQITFSGLDYGIDSSFPANMQGVIFPEDEPGFLAGVAAGSITNTSVVGVVGGNPVPPVQRYVYGFMNGVKYANPSATVLGTFVNDPTWSNRALGIAAAESFLARNADVIFGAGGGIGSAAILRAAQGGKWAIGVDVDESNSTFRNKTDPASAFILTSALKNVDLATYVVLKEKITGKFFPGNKRMDVTNGGVGLARCSGALACDQLARQYILSDNDLNSPSCSVTRKPVTELLSDISSRLGVGSISTAASGDGILQSVGKTANKTWSRIEGFGQNPNGLSGHTQTQAIGNTFIFFGGQTTTGSLNANLYFYNIDSFNWTVQTPAGTWPQGLQNHGAVFRKATQELFVVGGTRSDGSFNQDIWKFSMTSRTWTTVGTGGNGPTLRTRHSVALLADRDLYLWGGQDDGANILNDLWRLNLDSLTWQKLQGTSTGSGVPEASFSSLLIATNNTDLLLYGGSNGSQDLPTLWRFSTVASSWKLENPSGSAPPGLSGASGVLLDKRRLMLIGGSSAKVPQSGAWVYNALTNEWSRYGSWDLPFALQGMTAVAFNQSEGEGACGFEGRGYTVCTAVNKTMILLYGGAQPSKGISSSLLAAYPPDEPIPRFPQYIQDSILGVGYAVGGFGVLLSLLAISFTIYFRRKPAFKSASPTFLSMYAVGALFAFLGVVAYNLPVNVLYCKIGLWLFSEGCMLLFSAMVVKNWRIYWIFMKSRTAQVTIIKDAFLIMFVLALLLVNTGVLAAFTFLSPYQISSVVIDGDAWPICASPAINTWIWILLAPPALVLLYGVFISFSTRNVTSKFNESGQINLAIYVTMLSLIVLVPLSLTIKLPPTLHIISSLLTCLTLYTVIGTNFFSKIYSALFKTNDLFDMGSSNGLSSIDSSGEDTLCCKACLQPLRAGTKGTSTTHLSTVGAGPKKSGEQRRN